MNQGKWWRGSHPVVLFLFLFLFVVLVVTPTISAHFAGSAPYLKINGQYTILYSVPLNSEPNAQFELPEDNAPANYIVGQPLVFVLDKTFLPLSPSDIQKAQFFWDFGDGKKGTGITQTHTYNKIGSYILTIQIKNAPSFVTPFPAYPFESVLINILPNATYRLPQAIISANGQTVSDPLTGNVWLDLNKKVSFDASSSQKGSAPIVSYVWDFADTTTSNQKTVSHTYDPTTAQIYPMLRVKDANGFIADTFVEIDNERVTSGGFVSQKITSPKNILFTSPTQTLGVWSTLPVQVNDYMRRLIVTLFSPSKMNIFLLGIILLFAFFAGAMHALTPGHGKSLMAAYLVGKGANKIRDILIIAFSLTFSHTGIIYALGIIFLLINTSYPVNSLIPYFDKVSGIIVAFLACTLLYRGYRNFRQHRQKQQEIVHTHEHISDNTHVPSTVKLIVAGVSGGLSPCVDALALLLLAISIHQVVFGLLIVFIFSLGLAGCIIFLGFLLVIGAHKLRFEERLSTLAQVYAPLIAGLFILLLAIGLLRE